MVAKNDASGYYARGCVVQIQEEQRIHRSVNFSSMATTDLLVECQSRLEITKLIKIERSTQIVIAKAKVLPESEESKLEENEVHALSTELRELAV